MPPKRDAGDPLEGDTVECLTINYNRVCKSLGIQPHPKVLSVLADEEDPLESQLVLDADMGPLGAGGARAVATALLGSAPGLHGGPFTPLRSLRIWRCNIRDDGAAAVAELLRLGGDDLQLAFLELTDNKIGPLGCAALGHSLGAGNNVHLLTLRLDYNDTVGSEGAVALCAGLRTNSSLRQLHLPYCNVGAEGGLALCDLLMFTGSAIHVLNLQGNRLEGDGLRHLSIGLRHTRTLEHLNLSDNAIGHCDALEDFRDALIANRTLAVVEFMFNRIGVEGATTLQPALAESANIKQFTCDTTLPNELFTALYRAETKGGKKKKGKGKGKKKKKK